MIVSWWALAQVACWLLWGALCWAEGYREARRRWRPVANSVGMMQSPRTKHDE